jgi:hypothetical protein
MKRLLIAIMSVALLSSCHVGPRLTKANVDQITEGMSKKQVESILGPPTAIDTTDLILLKKTTYTYRQGNDSVTVVFRDDKVQSKDSTLTK